MYWEPTNDNYRQLFFSSAQRFDSPPPPSPPPPRILGFRIAPPVVGRKLNLTALKPVTSDKLLETYFIKGW